MVHIINIEQSIHVSEVPQTTLNLHHPLEGLIGPRNWNIYEYGLLQQKLQSKISNGKRHMWTKSGGNQAQVSKSPLLVESQRMCLISPAMMCGKTHEVLSTRQATLESSHIGIQCLHDWLSYRGSRPPEGKQVFLVNYMLSISYLDQLVQSDSRP